MFNLLISVLIVLLGSATCSSTEAALFSVSVIKVRQMAQSNSPSAIALLAIREKMNRPIATLVILNNLFNIVGSIVIGTTAASVLGDNWLGLFSAILTFLIIIFGEIIPKTLGERYAERLAILFALPITGLTFLFTPVVWVMEKITEPLTNGNKQPTTNEAEIQLLTNIGREEGIIEDDEAEMIQRVFRLNDLTAADLMTPRIAVTYLYGELTLAECKQQIIFSQHTRVLVVEDSIDKVIGIALKHELLSAMLEGKQAQKVATVTREARFVPEVVRADRLLKTFQENREHLLVVVDEYGGVAGVVTLEDVLEILTGEIVDETDRNINLRELALKRRTKMLQIESPTAERRRIERDDRR
ncbi:MAG TPA: HlyC/CorC family transporter [Cyanobacteria bacterium UBA8553]|nr:HlyC/CorC family transporter [Cyanobacteria bacterium UBA8553]